MPKWAFLPKTQTTRANASHTVPAVTGHAITGVGVGASAGNAKDCGRRTLFKVPGCVRTAGLPDVDATYRPT